MKVKYLILFSVLFLGGLVASCDEEENNTPQVGVVLKNSENEWVASMRSYSTTLLESYGLRYSIKYGASEQAQAKEIGDMVTRKAEIMIVDPQRLPKDSLNKAHNAGIPIVYLEYAATDTYAALVQIDNVKVGETAADFFKEQEGISKVAVLHVMQDSIVSEARREGLMQKLEMDTVTLFVGSSSISDGRTAFSTIRTNYPDVDAIYAQTDELAIGILEALGENDQIKVIVGGGGSKAYCDYIYSSKNITLATLLYSPKDMIETAVIEANDIIASRNIPDKKVIALETAIVDKSNLSSYIPVY
jgi:ABC-type sugar transport system, periplasmic component